MESSQDELPIMIESHCKNVFINEPAINDIVEQYVYKASTVQGDNRVAWLLRAITCIDLTTLSGDDTETNVRALCEKAAKPIALRFHWPEQLRTAAVCVYPVKANIATDALKSIKAHVSDDENGVRVAAVAAGFPSGQYPLPLRLAEIEYIRDIDEIDVVVDRSKILTHDWHSFYSELMKMRKACGGACMKTILSVGELPSLVDVYIASTIAMYAGSDFIKTSTGKETVNATLPVGVVMCRAIRDYHRVTGRKVGFKPAGGIKTATEAMQWLVLVKEELGNSWLNKNLFRIGASSLLDDIAKAIK